MIEGMKSDIVHMQNPICVLLFIYINKNIFFHNKAKKNIAYTILGFVLIHFSNTSLMSHAISKRAANS